MSKVFSAHAVSVDGYVSGRTSDGDEEFGRGGPHPTTRPFGVTHLHYGVVR
jgi:hypothetical protein